MGVSIRAFEKVEYCGPKACSDEDHVFIEEQKNHDQHADAQTPGCYKTEGKDYWFCVTNTYHVEFLERMSETFFRAQYFAIAWYLVCSSQPFADMIARANIGDYVGPQSCKKLAEDFKENREQFEEEMREMYAEEEDLLISLGVYDNYTNAFALAAENGIVVFT